MCGIAGILSINAAAPERGAVMRMTDRMAHRGPDGAGHYLRDQVALGHRRLSIIDLEGGEQPMFNEDHSIAVVYNGEIFNFKEVKAELEARGHIFRNHCDTEVIVHAYEEYGERCPEHFRGMFAFALYDAPNKRLFLGRDRLGIKPIYYCVSGGRLLFASEVKPILGELGSKPGVRTGLIDFYMSLGYVPGEETLFDGIRRLPPGHTMTVECGQIRTRQFWDISALPMLSIGAQEAEERLDQLLEESVRLRLMSDVPLGAFLSGGVDSSAIVSYMSRLSRDPVKTFSVGYEDDPASSELEFARIVARHLKTEHHEFILRSGDFFESLDTLLEHMEEPVVESAAVALYQLSRLAREHVTVILSGEGGDEILAGYPLYSLMGKVDQVRPIANLIPGPLRRMLANSIAGEKGIKYSDWVGLPLSKRYRGISNDVTDGIKSAMYQTGFREGGDKTVVTYFERLFQRLETGTNLRRMTYVDLKTWLPDDLLIKADKMTMACSLELRVPMLDHKLLEFCTALPDQLRRREGEGKVLLKKLMERHLPKEIIYRPKKGFPVPISVWFRGPLYERVREILLDQRTLHRGYFQPNYLSRVLERHRSGSEDLSRRIFSLLTLELWHRKYVD